MKGSILRSGAYCPTDVLLEENGGIKGMAIFPAK
jgi:hypothetical protein